MFLFRLDDRSLPSAEHVEVESGLLMRKVTEKSPNRRNISTKTCKFPAAGRLRRLSAPPGGSACAGYPDKPEKREKLENPFILMGELFLCVGGRVAGAGRFPLRRTGSGGVFRVRSVAQGVGQQRRFLLAARVVFLNLGGYVDCEER